MKFIPRIASWFWFPGWTSCNGFHRDTYFHSAKSQADSLPPDFSRGFFSSHIQDFHLATRQKDTWALYPFVVHSLLWILNTARKALQVLTCIIGQEKSRARCETTETAPQNVFLCILEMHLKRVAGNSNFARISPCHPEWFQQGS